MDVRLLFDDRRLGEKNMTLRGETYKFLPHLTSSDDDDIRKR